MIELKNTPYGADLVPLYVKAINEVQTLKQLKEIVEYWKPLVEDAYELVYKLDEKRFKKFLKDRDKERRGEYSESEDCLTILLPCPMFLIQRVADHFCVPFGIAWHNWDEQNKKGVVNGDDKQGISDSDTDKAKG